jgi:hypothetical protein
VPVLAAILVRRSQLQVFASGGGIVIVVIIVVVVVVIISGRGALIDTLMQILWAM